jgi:cardiolipin synthase
MTEDLIIIIENMIRKAPVGWVTSVCTALRCFPSTASHEYVLKNMPTTNNADLAFLLNEVVRLASTRMSWDALSWVINATYVINNHWHDQQQIELLWSGPSPANQIPARRIDQALYDLIANAKHEILLVTFAAVKIQRLSGELLKAKERGVHTKLILEFEASSEGQLSFDALKAFPPALVSAVEVYHWPVEKRERNAAGRPGKLHAKIAIVDNTALVSSANLTDDAFNRNLELGVMVKNPEFLSSVKRHLDSMIAEGTLTLLKY